MRAGERVNTLSLDSRYARWLCNDAGRPRRSRIALILLGYYVLFTATYVPINLFSVGRDVGSSRVDLQACKLEYSIVSPK